MLASDKLEDLVHGVTCMVLFAWSWSSITATRKSVQPFTLATGSQFMPTQADDMIAERIVVNICGQ